MRASELIGTTGVKDDDDLSIYTDSFLESSDVSYTPRLRITDGVDKLNLSLRLDELRGVEDGIDPNNTNLKLLGRHPYGSYSVKSKPTDTSHYYNSFQQEYNEFF